MASRIVTTISMTGPFFRVQPGKTFRQNVRVMMAAVAAEGEQDVKAQMAAGDGRRQPISRIGGHVSYHVIGRTTSLSGKPWAVSAVVSVTPRGGLNAQQAIALMAAGSVVAGQTRAFRKTKARIKRSRAVNESELLKGLR